MEKEQFLKELNDKIKELSLPGTISFSPNSYKSGFSSGANWAHELLSKEEITISGKEPDISQALSEMVKNAAILDSVIARLGESVNRLK